MKKFKVFWDEQVLNTCSVEIEASTQIEANSKWINDDYPDNDVERDEYDCVRSYQKIEETE